MPRPILRFQRGTRRLELNDRSHYYLHTDFTPPPVNLAYQLAEGTSANRTEGAQVVGTHAGNRTVQFTVSVLGSSQAEVSRWVNDLQTFVFLAGNELEPLYLDFHANPSYTEAPLWGQRGWLRFEVVSGTVAVFSDYLRGANLASDAEATVTLVVKPYAYGRAQRLCSAQGGVTEDVIASLDGVSRGTLVAEAVTNLFTNPVFGNATWNTGWTTAGNLVSSLNSDPAYGSSGFNAVRLVSKNAASNQFYQSLTLPASTHILTCYVRRPDGAAVTSSDCVIYYGSNQSTSFSYVGSGWYRAQATVTGTAGAANTGIAVLAAREVFVTAFQAEQKAYPTAFCCGDMLGCAWSGTAHASTSTRAAGLLSISIADDTLNLGQGTFCLVFRFDVPNTFAADMLLFDTKDGGHATSFQLYFRASDDKFVFTDGTNSAVSSAQTFSAGNAYGLHATYGPSGLALYVNGAADGTSGTYTPPSTGARLAISTTYAGGSAAPGAVIDVGIFAQALASSDVSADFTNLTPLLTGGKRVSPVPYLWTKDGDDIVDNCDDSTHDNWAVAAGIPGSAPAISQFVLTPSQFSSAIWLGKQQLPYSDWVAPSTPQNYEDDQGTVDANSSGGQYLSRTINAIPWAAGTTGIAPVKPWLMTGSVHAFIRLNQTSGNGCTLTPALGYTSGTVLSFPTPRAITASATMKNYYLGAMMFVPYPNLKNVDRNLAMSVVISITDSVASVVNVDLVLYIAGKVCTVPAPGNNKMVDLTGRYAVTRDTSTSKVWANSAVTGDVIELDPDLYNHLSTILASDAGSWTITDTITFTKVVVTPRWGLL